ncbi:hypothetical protein C4D60_Mb06t15650 [Musa balbisiana]|uniref:Uncharacterized protein n=1 Tax=Musa balbisiana TaxID=52838 RepID=A0A4S8IN91_MUSBA|nr:hypothetical protein C4D60_Mb06t15650 [Musa balbisiana]
MKGNQGAMVLAPPSPPPANPVAQLQTRIKEMETGFRAWLAKQPTAVEAAIVTATSAAQGAFIGALMGSLTSDASSALPTPPPNAPGLNPQAMASLKQAQAFAGGPLVQARNFAVMTGTNAGISCVMKRIRGVEDMQGSMVAAFGSGAMFSLVSGMGGPNQALNAVTSGLMVAAFGSGAMFSLVSGMGGPNQALNAVTSGLFFSLVQGGLFKIGEKFSQPPADDVLYSGTKRMLTNLGLQNYEKNFKKGLLMHSEMSIFHPGQGFSFLITFRAWRM